MFEIILEPMRDLSRSTAESRVPLMRWRRFLASMQELPQEEKDFREWTEWARAVIEWKTGGEKGPAPERIKPVLGPPPRAPQLKP